MDNEIVDKFDRLVEWIGIIETRVSTINERTKRHTLDIRELRKIVKSKEEEYQKEIIELNNRLMEFEDEN